MSVAYVNLWGNARGNAWGQAWHRLGTTWIGIGTQSCKSWII